MLPGTGIGDAADTGGGAGDRDGGEAEVDWPKGGCPDGGKAEGGATGGGERFGTLGRPHLMQNFAAGSSGAPQAAQKRPGADATAGP